MFHYSRNEGFYHEGTHYTIGDFVKLRALAKRNRSIYRVDELFYSDPVLDVDDGKAGGNDQKRDKVQQRVESTKPSLKVKLTRFKYRSSVMLILSLLYSRLGDNELVCTSDQIEAVAAAIGKKKRIYLPGEVVPDGECSICLN